jgi:outer membrane protein
VKHIFLLFISCLAVLSIAVPASAFELGVRGYYWFPKLSGDIRVDNAGINGTKLDLEDDLGIDSKSYPVFEVFSGLGKHHLSFAFYNLDYDGDTVLTKDVYFNGELFHANERIVSHLKYDNYDVMYRYDLINLENFLAGGSLGLVARMMVFDGSASIASASVTTRQDFTAPIPMVGANFHVGILKDLIEARLLVTGIGYHDNTAFDGQAEISLTPFPFLDIHGGYRFFKINADQDDVKLDFDNSGLYVALTVSF